MLSLGTCYVFYILNSSLGEECSCYKSNYSCTP